MKQQLIERLQTLTTFLNEVEVINNNPYSAGLDVKKVLSDLKGFTKETLEIAEQLPEEAPDEIEKEELASEEQ